LRIARELHDVLGHHVSVMGVQAAGAQRVLGTDPHRARDALQAIERSSRQAVTELQRVLALLQVDDDRQRPELRRLEELVGDVHDAGVKVSLHVEPLPDLPASVDLAATRVIQEALTNVLRHTGRGAAASVRVTAPDAVGQVGGEDAGQGRAPVAPAGPPGGGRGLVGLRERVELHGGEFQAGPRSPAGFRVVATLPVRHVSRRPGP
jgi:signal transduction histidine kinase